jgi:hypothetical protein
VRFQVSFQLLYLGCKLPVAGEQLAQSHEGAHDQHAHLHGPLGIEHSGSHDCPMLRECVRQVAAPATPLF